MTTVTCSETDMASRRGKKEVVAKIIRCKGRGTSKFLYPLNVTVNKRGELIISDAGNKRIKVMDKNGKPKPGIKLNFKPLDVAMSAEGKYLIIDGSGKKIAVHKENGDFERYLSDENVKNPYPWRIATSPADGSVYVAHWDGIVAKGTDKENHCIRKYNSNLEYVKSFGSYGIDDGQFEGPNYLHVSSDGVVYVSDWGNHRIQAFNEDGEFMFAFGSFGEGDGQFSFPEGLVTDTEGNLYACSRKKNFVQKFDHKGKFVSRIANSKDVGLKRATGLLVTEDMKVAVADLGDYSIKVFEY
ncbi:tripartite motif-containing protein 2-like [Ptychodera flava]|uniref:tripartite motif-containing protein 2-like n=1 Tax=Ptychodera flava TaxID=63121 RepID=UPI00396A4963